MSKSPRLAGRRSRRWLESATAAWQWADRYTLWALNPPSSETRAGQRRSFRPVSAADDPMSPPAPATAELISVLVTEERERANSWDDSVRTLRDLNLLADQLSDSVVDLRSDLPRAVRDLRRQGWSFELIAARSGLSVTRVIELARESRARRL